MKKHDEPTRYSLTDLGIAALEEYDAATRDDDAEPRLARRRKRKSGAPGATEPLGRSPAVLPSQKQVAASGPPSSKASPIPARPEEERHCTECRRLLSELSHAVHDFSEVNGPFVRSYPLLSYSQVAAGKQALEELGARVNEARERFKRHNEKHEAGAR